MHSRREIVIIQLRQRPDETIFPSRRKHPETKGCVRGC